MEWRDEGLVIGVRRHGETSAIVELMTQAHGRHLGVVRGGRSRTMRPILQAGNGVEATWRARLDDHLGTFALEGTTLRAAALMTNPAALDGINCIAALLRLLPERDPHATLYEAAVLIADSLDEPLVTPALIVRFELELLSELGFGLDLGRCAATGTTDDLCYVSPKSGRAVSREAGLPYHDRLLRLPGFIASDRGVGSSVVAADIAAGFTLTGHFLMRDLFGARGIPMPDARRSLVDRLRKAEAAADP